MAHRFSKLKQKLSASSLLLTLIFTVFSPVYAADSDLPSDVEGIKATPGDESITLSWSPATDNTAVAGYYVYSGLSSVAEEGGTYTFGSVDAGAKTQYKMENLSNGLTYYFAVTAYDESGNESEYYSQEVSATPEASGNGDFTAPTVAKANAMTSTLLEISFSEDVVLPADAKSAFSVEASDGTALEIVDAYLSEDESIVFLSTVEQTDGVQYIVTAGSSIKDKAGNPIVSGTADLAVFDGSSKLALEAPLNNDSESNLAGDLDDLTASESNIVSVEMTKTNELLVTFAVDMSSSTPEDFLIKQKSDETKTLEVLAVIVDAQDSKKITLVTAEMQAGEDYTLQTGEDSKPYDFSAKTLELADLIAPEDITNLIAKISNETAVLLTWTKSVNSSGDLATYMVYMSNDEGKTFDTGVKVDKNDTKKTVSNLTQGKAYTFKVTAIDEKGNESEGTLVAVALPESGPEMILLGVMSLGFAGFAQKRKNRQNNEI